MTVLVLPYYSYLFIILFPLAGHYDERQRYLLGAVSGTYKGIHRQELLEWIADKLEGAVDVPGLGAGEGV